MKKILSTLLLLVFFTVQATLAGDTVIIGSDGQTRWADKNKTENLTLDYVNNINQKDILREVMITDSQGNSKLVYIDYQGNVKNIEEKKAPVDLSYVIDESANNKYRQLIASAPSKISNGNQILLLNGYSFRDYTEQKKKFVKIDLLDGDYIKYYKGNQYFAEYHKNGELMGMVKVEEYDKSKEKQFAGFYEYRIQNPSSEMTLKHVMFYESVKDNYFSQYIYDSKGKLLCGQKNNNIYIAEDSRDMIKNLNTKFTIQKISASKNRIVKKPKNKFLRTAKEIIVAPFDLTFALIQGFTIPLAAPFFIIMIWYTT